MYKLFEKGSFIAYSILALLYVLLVVGIFYSRSHSQPSDEWILFQWVGSFSTSVGFFCVLQSVIFLFLIIGQHIVYKSLSYVGRSTLVFQAIFIIDCIISIYFHYSFTDILIVGFVLFLFAQLTRANKIQQTAAVFFNIGFVFGLFLLVSIKFILFFPILLLCINIYGKTGVKDISAYILGFLTPVYIVFSMLFLTDKFDVIHHYFNTIRLFDYGMVKNLEIGALVVIAGRYVSTFPIISSYNINTRKLYTILSSMMFLYIPFYIFFRFEQSKSFLFLFLISSYYFSSLFVSFRRERTKNILLILGILLAIIVTFANINR